MVTYTHVKEESVHLADMPEVVEVDRELLDKWNTLMDLRDDVKPCFRTSS